MGEEIHTPDMLKNTLETYPALKGIFCTNEDMADQTLDALADMENTEQIQIAVLIPVKNSRKRSRRDASTVP